MKFAYAILLTALIAYAASAQTEPVDTDGNGYRNISTLDHLRWLSFSSDYMDENYELDNDINAADTRNWNDGEGFYQISEFRGKFNGNGYEIDSLYISRIDRSRIGFFSSASSAEIKNLGITNCDIQGENYVGSLLADDFSSCTITNCYSTGNVKGISNVGGLVGDSQNSTISNCYSNSNVNGEESVGGLVGSDISTVFMNSYSTGNVIGSSFYVGGLVGETGAYTTIINCYSTGNVNGDSYVGGLAGWIEHSTIVNSYSTGNVSGNDALGGLVGYDYTSYMYSTVKSSFWDTETSGQSESDGSTGKSTHEMKNINTFTDAGWDFKKIWSIDPEINEGYPYLMIDSVNTSIVDFRKIDQNAKIYPNPVYNSFSINSEEEIISVEVFDPEGKLVISFDRNMTSYDISSLSSGFYFVKVNYRKKYQLIKIVKG